LPLPDFFVIQYFQNLHRNPDNSTIIVCSSIQTRIQILEAPMVSWKCSRPYLWFSVTAALGKSHINAEDPFIARSIDASILLT